jgi:hypothetical protein
MQLTGLAFIVFSLSIILILVLQDVITWFGSSKQDNRAEDMKMWNDLSKINNMEVTVAYWHEYYRSLSIKLNKILARFFSIDKPLSSEECNFDLSLKFVLKELEKVYQSNATPDLACLKENLTKFYEKNIRLYGGK